MKNMGLLFLIGDFQLINIEGKIDKHHLASTTVIIVVGKNHQWMLISVDEM